MPDNQGQTSNPNQLPAEVAVIALGGGVGSLARYAVSSVFPAGRNEIPWSTLAINVSGSFLLGALVVAVVQVWPDRRLVRPFFGTGVLGGFTTFSTFAVEVRGRPAGTAWTYLGLSLVLGIAAAAIGMALMQKALRQRTVAPPDVIDPLDPDQP